MPSERAHRSEKSDQFDIVVIPAGQGGTSRSYRLSKRKLWFLGSGALLVIVLAILAGLIYTPLASVIPIPNSVLEEKYGRQPETENDRPGARNSDEKSNRGYHQDSCEDEK